MPLGASYTRVVQSVAGEHQSNDLPDVSVICATYQRPEFLRKQIDNFFAQSYAGKLEMLILDDSPEPSGYLFDLEYRKRGVKYYHMPEKRLTVGRKMQMMSTMARGSIIAVCDDDDYYAPRYIERMVEFLGDADFCTLSRWFAYSPADATFGYWETDVLRPAAYIFAPGEPVSRMPVSTEGWNPDVTGILWGYGFSYVWRKAVFPRVEIADITFDTVCWDWDFYTKLRDAGFRTVCAPDNEGLLVHILHPRSGSKMFPQYLLPEFMLADYFPDYVPLVV